jgi:uncharacterized protein (TIGR02996 family)
MSEDGFLRALLADPKGDTTRLVYADWLEEQGDPVSDAKAEFLRLTVEGPAPKNGRKKKRRLQQLAAELDTDWLAVVSRLPIEHCLKKRIEGEPAGDESIVESMVSPLGFDFLCDRHWEDLQATEDRAVRFCDDCSQNVHYCDTIMEARDHAQAGHCIAVDLGAIRRDRDLAPRQMWLGRPSVKTLQAEEERMKPDPVSKERERRKRDKRKG